MNCEQELETIPVNFFKGSLVRIKDSHKHKFGKIVEIAWFYSGGCKIKVQLLTKDQRKWFCMCELKITNPLQKALDEK